MDLINAKLSMHLSELPFSAGDSLLGIDELVFELMGLEKLSDLKLDQVFKNYEARSGQIRNLSVIVDQHKIDRLAEELYEYLKSEEKAPPRNHWSG